MRMVSEPGARRRGRRHVAAVAAVVAAVALAACGSSPAAAGRGHAPAGRAALPVAPIGHAGRWLTDAEGRVLLLHGVDVVVKQPPYEPASAGFSAADAAFLASEGFRVVRLGVLATGLMPTPGRIDTAYLASLASTVRVLTAHGVLVLLDMHQDGFGPAVGSDGFPAWMTLTGSAANTHAPFPTYYVSDPAVQQAFQSFWDDQVGPGGVTLQADYADMLSALARTFAHVPDVLGYDLFNEPWPGTTWQPCLADANGCPSLDAHELAPAYARADRAIRAAGDHHLVFAEPFVLFNYGQSVTHVPLPGGDPASGLSFHLYTATPAAEPQVLRNAVAWSRSTGGALLNTEWGATTSVPAILRQAGELDGALLPWIFWSLTPYLVRHLTAAPSGANLDTAALGALVQPSAVAVAGTPTRFAYQPSTRVLSASWRSSRPGGGTYAPGVVSTFDLPRAVYPGGYRVTVAGTRVVSAPCASLLELAAAPGARTQSVTVSPGSCPSR